MKKTRNSHLKKISRLHKVKYLKKTKRKKSKDFGAKKTKARITGNKNS